MGCLVSRIIGSKVPYSTTFLDCDSELRSYFLGFFVTDGWLSWRGTKSKSVHISSTDRQVIDDLATATRYTNKIVSSSRGGYPRSGTDHRLSYARDVRDRVLELGFTNRKTGHEFIPSGISDTTFHHFIRGVSDGDGSIELRRDGRISWSLISASEAFLCDILDQLKERRVVVARRVHIKPRPGHSFRIRLSLSDTLNLCEYMYKEATLCIHRKREVYRRSLAEAAPLHSQRLWSLEELEMCRCGSVPPGRSLAAYKCKRWEQGWR